jgi:hypothetical protein
VEDAPPLDEDDKGEKRSSPCAVSTTVTKRGVFHVVVFSPPALAGGGGVRVPEERGRTGAERRRRRRRRAPVSPFGKSSGTRRGVDLVRTFR